MSDQGSVSVHKGVTTTKEPCKDCPWRVANHGRRHPGGWYRKTNLVRLWNQIRKGGGMQTCHPTDPSHPDHQKYGGAKEGSEAQECVGSVVLMTRELLLAGRLGKSGETMVDPDGTDAYLAVSRSRRGLTADGMMWVGFHRAFPPPIGLGRPMPSLPRAVVDAEWIGRADDPDGYRKGAARKPRTTP